MPKPTGSKISTTSGGGWGPRCPSPKEHIQLSNNDWILAGDLKVGDEVMTSKEPQKVTRVQRVENSPRCEVLFEEGDSIVSSYTHPYFVNSKGFVEVGNLEKGDVIGDLVVKNKKSFSDGPVISLSVDEAETYMLRGGTKESPVPVLSHNKTPKRPDKIVKKRGGKRPSRPGWGQALLGRSRRGWSNGGTAYPGGIAGIKKTVAEIEGMSPAWTGTPAKKMVMNIAKTRRQNRPPSKTTKRVPGGWSLGGALNSKRTGYQSGRTVNPRSAGEAAMKRQRRMQWNNRTTPVPAGWGAHGSPFSGRGWDKGGPTKFRDDQSLGIRDGKVRKPVGYQGGGTSGYSDAYLQGQGVDPAMYRTANRKLMKQRRQNILSGKSVRTSAPKRKRISTKKGGGG